MCIIQFIDPESIVIRKEMTANRSPFLVTSDDFRVVGVYQIYGVIVIE